MKVKRLFKWTARGLLLLFVALIVWGVISYWTGRNDCDQRAGALVHPMKAVRSCEYGVVTFAEVEKPVPKDNQVLIKARAASINSIDAYLVRDMWLVRLLAGLRKPRDTRLGRDVAGEVEAVGKNVTQFQPGDEVFGLAGGSLADYAVSSGRALIMKPGNVTFEQAASIPLAGLTALQGLRKGNIHAEQKVLINGATGGVGTLAVQIAKSFGADVTAVCSTRNLELAHSIGADHVIDYMQEDFAKGEQRYDMIFDNVVNHSVSERRRVLNPKGICVLVGIGGTSVRANQVLGRIAGNFTAPLFSAFSDQKFVQYITQPNNEDLALLGQLLATGQVRPVIERTCKLSEAADALCIFDRGHARGKVVITME